jgi:hypothetical protein
MLGRNLLLKISALMLVALFLVGLPASISAAGNDTWRPNLPPAGTGSVVWTNHFGQGAELILDLEGTLYKVAEKTNDIPGRLQLNLAPGTYTYTASVPGVGAAGRTVEVVAGRVINLSFVGRVEIKEDNHRSDDDEDKFAFEPLTYDEVLVYQEDITDQAR